MRTTLFHHYFQEVKKYAFDYAVLVGISMAALMGIWYYRGYQETQLAITTFFALGYMLWGVLHHIKDKTFHMKVISEYILIGILIIVLAKLILN